MSHTRPPHIVRLDGGVSPAPIFSPSFQHTYTSHDRTPPSSATISSHLATADIAITTRVPITAATLAKCPRLKLIAVFAIGTDMIDLAACKERGVQVCNVPAASNEAVAEHAIALFFALRRNIVGVHNKLVNTEDWIKTGNLTPTFGGLPGTCREEVMGIIGAGELGNRVATIARALGMSVLLSARKNPTSPTTPIPGRTAFTTLLQQSTVIILTCPLTPSTLNLISGPELSLMRPDALLINVARGGIVDEEALVCALREGRLKGAASDVFVEEPAGEANSVLLRELKKEGAAGELDLGARLVVSPHVAWYARSSIEKLRRVVGENIEGWVGGEEGRVCFVELGESNAQG